MQPELEAHDNDRGRLLQRAEQAAAHGNWQELEDAVSLLEYFELRHDAMVDDIVAGTLSEMIAQIEANQAREHVEECMGESQSVGAWLGETLQLVRICFAPSLFGYACPPLPIFPLCVFISPHASCFS